MVSTWMLFICIAIAITTIALAALALMLCHLRLREQLRLPGLPVPSAYNHYLLNHYILCNILPLSRPLRLFSLAFS